MHGIAAAGGEADPPVAGGGAADEIIAQADAGGAVEPLNPLSTRILMNTVYNEARFETRTFSLVKFDPESTVGIRGIDDSLYRQISAVFRRIDGFQLAYAAIPYTDFVICLNNRQSMNRAARERLLDSDRSIIDNGGVVVPREHSLMFSYALSERYHFMLLRNIWPYPSIETQRRYALHEAMRIAYRHRVQSRTHR